MMTSDDIRPGDLLIHHTFAILVVSVRRHEETIWLSVQDAWTDYFFKTGLRTVKWMDDSEHDDFYLVSVRGREGLVRGFILYSHEGEPK